MSSSHSLGRAVYSNFCFLHIRNEHCPHLHGTIVCGISMYLILRVFRVEHAVYDRRGQNLLGRTGPRIRRCDVTYVIKKKICAIILLEFYIRYRLVRELPPPVRTANTLHPPTLPSSNRPRAVRDRPSAQQYCLTNICANRTWYLFVYVNKRW